MLSLFASPGDDYLKRIGELAYAVSSLEWVLLGDLHRLAAHLPADATVSDLAGHTTGRIARHLRAAANRSTDAGVGIYLSTGADALDEVSEYRNAVLHARPATIDGQPRLYRWRSKPASPSRSLTIGSTRSYGGSRNSRSRYIDSDRRSSD